MSREYFVENKWTCTSCGSVNLGRYLSCQECGNAKDKKEAANETMGGADDAPVSGNLLERAKAAPHWTCRYCEGQQRDKDGNCVLCGGAKVIEGVQERLRETQRGDRSPRSEIVHDTEEHFSVRLTTAPKEEVPPKEISYIPSPADSKARFIRKEEARQFFRSLPDPPSSILVSAEPPGKFKSNAPIAWLGVGGTLLILFLIWIFVPREFTAKVVSMKWIHMAWYEERQTLHGQGWGSPVGAFNVSCEAKYYGTQRCNPYNCNPHQVSYSCNSYSCNCRTVRSCSNAGNGFSRCSESEKCSTCYRTCYRQEYDTCWRTCPIYKQWCDYAYYEWVRRGERTLSGASPKTMMWPDIGPLDETHRQLQTPAYIVNFVEGKGSYSYDPGTAEEFSRFEDGQTWICEKRLVGTFKPLRRR